MKNLTFLLTLFLFFSISAKAQEECKVETIKAVIPHYPIAAIALNTVGEVEINVKIDTNGKAISSLMERGPKILKEISEKSSMKWTFSKVQKNKSKCKVRIAKIIFEYILLPKGSIENEDSWSYITFPFRATIKKVKPDISTM